MALQDMLVSSGNTQKIGVSPERVEAVIEPLREYVAFWREYPDMFVDFMQSGWNPEIEEKLTFHLLFYQRVFLRIAMRYKYVYAVYPRASMAPINSLQYLWRILDKLL